MVCSISLFFIFIGGFSRVFGLKQSSTDEQTWYLSSGIWRNDGDTKKESSADTKSVYQTFRDDKAINQRPFHAESMSQRPWQHHSFKKSINEDPYIPHPGKKSINQRSPRRLYVKDTDLINESPWRFSSGPWRTDGETTQESSVDTKPANQGPRMTFRDEKTNNQRPWSVARSVNERPYINP